MVLQPFDQYWEAMPGLALCGLSSDIASPVEFFPDINPRVTLPSSNLTQQRIHVVTPLHFGRLHPALAVVVLREFKAMRGQTHPVFVILLTCWSILRFCLHE